MLQTGNWSEASTSGWTATRRTDQIKPQWIDELKQSGYIWKPIVNLWQDFQVPRCCRSNLTGLELLCIKNPPKNNKFGLQMCNLVLTEYECMLVGFLFVNYIKTHVSLYALLQKTKKTKTTTSYSLGVMCVRTKKVSK